MPVAKNFTETRMNRRLTSEFLDAEPAEITIMRPTMVKTAAGGLKTGTPAVLNPQRFRLIPFKKRLVRMTANTPDGDVINLQYVLVGDHDADVQPGDWFFWDGSYYDVISIEPNRAYRTAANVTYRGTYDSSLE